MKNNTFLHPFVYGVASIGLGLIVSIAPAIAGCKPGQTVTRQTTLTAYAPGCGHTDACPPVRKSNRITVGPGWTIENVWTKPGSSFGRYSGPKIDYLAAGTLLSESELESMAASSSGSASGSASGFGGSASASGGFNTSTASSNVRNANVATTVDAIILTLEATGRRAFWRGPGSQSEYTLYATLSCQP